MDINKVQKSNQYLNYKIDNNLELKANDLKHHLLNDSFKKEEENLNDKNIIDKMKSYDKPENTLISGIIGTLVMTLLGSTIGSPLGGALVGLMVGSSLGAAISYFNFYSKDSDIDYS
ncbi:MAG: glycine zipper family protein [bacterium]